MHGFGLVLLAVVTAPPGRAIDQGGQNTLTKAEQADGWRLLFDGKTLAGWHGYAHSGPPQGWAVEAGALTRVARGGDIVTDQKFASFELTLEWKIEPGGNSGIFYRGVEADESHPIFMSAPEMQVLDDAKHEDGQSPLTSAGSDYGLYPAPRGVVKPANEWNAVRLIVKGNHVEHWLNGKQIVTYELGSPDWGARVKQSKFREWPAYGKAATGVIGLQDHGNRVAFRNLKIKPL